MVVIKIILVFILHQQALKHLKKNWQYDGSKGAIQFPLDKPLPVGLITQIVKFRVAKPGKSKKEITNN